MQRTSPRQHFTSKTTNNNPQQSSITLDFTYWSVRRRQLNNMLDNHNTLHSSNTNTMNTTNPRLHNKCTRTHTHSTHKHRHGHHNTHQCKGSGSGVVRERGSDIFFNLFTRRNLDFLLSLTRYRASLTRRRMVPTVAYTERPFGAATPDN